jgi:hypothetical protein
MDIRPSRARTPPRDFIPTRIEYTGSQSDGTPALRSVEFVWEDRSDTEARMMSGLRIPRNKRLKELRMSGPNPTSADPSPRRPAAPVFLRLSEQQGERKELAEDSHRKRPVRRGQRPHKFDWELGQSTFRETDTGIWDIKSTPAGYSPLPGRIRVADFDGDGRDDILYVPQIDPNYFYILRSDPASPTGFSAPYNTNIPVPRDPKNGRVYVYPDPAGDFMNIFCAGR